MGVRTKEGLTETLAGTFLLILRAESSVLLLVRLVCMSSIVFSRPSNESSRSENVSKQEVTFLQLVQDFGSCAGTL